MPSTSPNASDSLRQAIDYLPQGVAVFDAAAKLVVSNGRYQTRLALPDSLVEPQTALLDTVRFLATRGDLGPGDASQVAAERINQLTAAPTTVMQLTAIAGQALEFQS